MRRASTYVRYRISRIAHKRLAHDSPEILLAASRNVGKIDRRPHVGVLAAALAKARDAAAGRERLPGSDVRVAPGGPRCARSDELRLIICCCVMSGPQLIETSAHESMSPLAT